MHYINNLHDYFRCHIVSMLIMAMHHSFIYLQLLIYNILKTSFILINLIISNCGANAVAVWPDNEDCRDTGNATKSSARRGSKNEEVFRPSSWRQLHYEKVSRWQEGCLFCKPSIQCSCCCCTFLLFVGLSVCYGLLFRRRIWGSSSGTMATALSVYMYLIFQFFL